MTATSTRLIAVLSVVGVAAGWALATIAAGWTGRSVPLPVLAGSALWLLAIALGVWGWQVRPRIRARHRPDVAAETAIPRHTASAMPPLQAARVAVLSMAAARMGALVAGVYSGIIVATIAGGLSTPAAVQSFWSGVLAATGAAATSGVGLWIERACVLPVDENDDR